MKLNKTYIGDCLELMPLIPDKSIDMILCDLPYGTTACKWDVIIPFEPLWEQYKRVIKDNGAIVLTASQPFTSALVMSNIKMFKYEWIWDKKRGGNFMTAKTQPIKEHENILVFYKNIPIYNPIKINRKSNRFNRSYDFETLPGEVYGNIKSRQRINMTELRMPKSILEFPLEVNNQFKKQRFHPTQKPVLLFEYLIKTYTNEGNLVLDNCAGSGTTAIACINTNRNYICMEKDEKYFDIAEKRIKNHLAQQNLTFK
jgi:site-specific DNA-methyltransferase (adenine-specific)